MNHRSPPEDRLRELCRVVAPSGREGAMTETMRAAFAEYTDRVSVDWLGNVSATFGDGFPSLLFSAHMDEVGFIVRTVTTEGYLRVERLGGIHPRAVSGARVVVLGDEGPVPGVVGLPSYHVTPTEERHIVPPVERWYLDIGARSAEEAREMGVDVGCVAGYAPVFQQLRNDLVLSKTLDDRAGCWVLVELARRFAEKPPPTTVHLLANVQEEFHQRGLLPAVRRLRPHVVVCLDVTPAADTPELRGRNAIRLGDGPTVKVMDYHRSLKGLFVPEFLVGWIEGTALSGAIPTQREVATGVVTDTTHLPDLNIPTAGLGIPIRYAHSASEVVSLRDLAELADLCDGLASTVSALEPYLPMTEVT